MSTLGESDQQGGKRSIQTMLSADPKEFVVGIAAVRRVLYKCACAEFTIVKAEAKAPHVDVALAPNYPNAFPKSSAIPELVGFRVEAVHSAGPELPLSRGSVSNVMTCTIQVSAATFLS